MPAKPSGEIKTRIVHNTQKNGDVCVYERKTVYDSVKKYNRVLSAKLLSKIPKGFETPVQLDLKGLVSIKDQKSLEKLRRPVSIPA
jgi:hypothetical protein